MLKNLIHILLLLSLCQWCFAQERVLVVNGNVTDGAGKAIKNATVAIHNVTTGEIYTATSSDQKGEFSAQLPEEKEYVITIEQLGFISKKILVNTTMRHKPRKNPSIEFEVVLTKHMRKKEGVELLNKPVVKIYYNEKSKTFTYDPIYAKNIDKEVKALNRKLEASDAKLPNTEKILTQEDSLEYIKSIITKIQINTKQKMQEAESLARKKEVLMNKKAIEAVLAKPAVKEVKKVIVNEAAAHDTSTTVGGRAFLGIKKTLTEIEGQLKIRQAGKGKQQNIETTQSEIIEEQFRLITNRNAQLYNEKLNKLKAQNMKLKYESSNPLTSMLDVIDEYEKALKQMK